MYWQIICPRVASSVQYSWPRLMVERQYWFRFHADFSKSLYICKKLKRSAYICKQKGGCAVIIVINFINTAHTVFILLIFGTLMCTLDAFIVPVNQCHYHRQTLYKIPDCLVTTGPALLYKNMLVIHKVSGWHCTGSLAQ